MTAVDRLLWWPWLPLWRFLAQFGSRKGRRRLRRRAVWRVLALLAFGPWIHPFFVAQMADELNHFVRGRVQVRGSAEPVTGVAVVLVPVTASGSDAEPLWLWPDVDGWFSTHAFPGGVYGGVYAVDVRRPGCAVEHFGVRRLWLGAVWGRRLDLEIGPCRTS